MEQNQNYIDAVVDAMRVELGVRSHVAQQADQEASISVVEPVGYFDIPGRAPINIGPEYVQGFVDNIAALKSSQYIIPTTEPVLSHEFDLEIYDANNNRIFGRNVTNHDTLLVSSDLVGVSSVPLPISAVQPAIRTFFRDSRIKVTQTSTLNTTAFPSEPVTFVSDAELAIFVRDPAELKSTLMNSPSGHWNSNATSLANFITGELPQNPPPFEIPAVVALPVRDDSGAYNTVSPTLTHFFSFTTPFSNKQQATSTWASTAAGPSGTGSIKGLRLLEYGPCDAQINLQPILNEAKKTIVKALNACNQGLGAASVGLGGIVDGFVHVKDIRFIAFDIIPYVTRNEPGKSVNLITSTESMETQTGFLVRAHIWLDIASVASWSPIDIEFVVDYRLILNDGMVDVVTSLHRYQLFGGLRGLSSIIDGVFRTGSVPDFYGMLFQPKDHKSLIFGAIPDMLRATAREFQNFDFNARGMPISRLCHGSGANAPMDCTAAADTLEALVNLGVNQFFPNPLTMGQQNTLHATIHHGEKLPDGTGNWFCEPDSFKDTEDERLAKKCKFRLRMRRAVVNLDSIVIAPFFDFAEFDSPGLVLFLALFGFGPLQVDVAGLKAGTHPYTFMCNRDRPGARESVNFFNRWYSTVRVSDLGCAEHSPALFARSCTTDADCFVKSTNAVRPSVCVNRRCELVWNGCSTNADCYPWQVCSGAGCVAPARIGPCESDWDPFRTVKIPGQSQPCGVGNFCNNGECWRI